VFFAPDGEGPAAREVREAQAKEICSWCPVRAECAEYAITRKEQAGVWGGLGEDELAAERRRRARKAQESRRALQPKKPAAKPAPTPEPVRVDGTGTHRRLRALATLGHGPTMIAARMTCGSKSLLGDLRDRMPRPVTVEVAEQVAALYRVLVEQAPGPLGAQVVAKARRCMWLGPESWAGVDMDDPAAVPREVPVEDTRSGQAAIEQARRLLAEAGITADIVTHETAA